MTKNPLDLFKKHIFKEDGAPVRGLHLKMNIFFVCTKLSLIAVHLLLAAVGRRVVLLGLLPHLVDGHDLVAVHHRGDLVFAIVVEQRVAAGTGEGAQVGLGHLLGIEQIALNAAGAARRRSGRTRRRGHRHGDLIFLATNRLTAQLELLDHRPELLVAGQSAVGPIGVGGDQDAEPLQSAQHLPAEHRDTDEIGTLRLAGLPPPHHLTHRCGVSLIGGLHDGRRLLEVGRIGMNCALELGVLRNRRQVVPRQGVPYTVHGN